MTKVSSFSEPALNGTRSISGKIWRKRLTDERLALALSQKCSLPDLVSRVLVGRGVDIESVNTFLTPSLRKQIPDPSQFLDMDQAVARIFKAIKLRYEKLGRKNHPQEDYFSKYCLQTFV